MSSSYEIRYLKTAEDDIYEIFDYIKKDRLKSAQNLLKKFDSSIATLAQNPYIGIIPNNDTLKDFGYRILVVDKYLVFYKVTNKVILIYRILHGARKYQFLL